METKLNKRPLISLFTGAGGLDLGLEMAGFTTYVSNELKPEACETLRKNKELAKVDTSCIDSFVQALGEQRCYKSLSPSEKSDFFQRLSTTDRKKFLSEAKIIEGDLREISSERFLEALDGDSLYCVAGGPPCQPFSKAGKQQSLDCTKNGDLFFHFVRIVSSLKPKWFVFENVKGLTFTKTDVLYCACNDCQSDSIAPFPIRQNFKQGESPSQSCSHCGSDNTHWVVKNESGGSLKIILNEFQKAGYSCQTKILNSADFGAPQIRERLFIVGSLSGKNIKWPSPTHSRPSPPNKQEDLFAETGSGQKPWVSILDALWASGHPKYGNLDRSSAVLWVKNVVRPHDEPVTWNLDRPAPTIGAHQGAKLAIAPIGVPEEQIYRQQWHTKGRRQGDTPPVFVEHEYLSDEELLALQTFPRWWYLHGTRMERAFQIGNAVPPLLAELVGKSIIEAEEYGD